MFDTSAKKKKKMQTKMKKKCDFLLRYCMINDKLLTCVQCSYSDYIKLIENHLVCIAFAPTPMCLSHFI